jgi:hypothetical protein
MLCIVTELLNVKHFEDSTSLKNVYLWQAIHYLMNLKIKLIYAMQLSRSSYLKDRDISYSAELIFSVLKENLLILKQT